MHFVTAFSCRWHAETPVYSAVIGIEASPHATFQDYHYGSPKDEILFSYLAGKKRDIFLYILARPAGAREQ